MGIRHANFTPISNRCALRRAMLCPLVRSYQERRLISILGECTNRNIAVVGYYGGLGVLIFGAAVTERRGV